MPLAHLENARRFSRRTALSVFIGGAITSACDATPESAQAVSVAPTPISSSGSSPTPLTSSNPPATSAEPTSAPPVAPPIGTGPIAIPYGPDPSQFGELTVPANPATTLVVLIHGGFWYDSYDLDLGRPLAIDLVGHGYPVWNLEYRRNGNGGGYPQTFEDVASGIDAVATFEGIQINKVVVIGHSAGGHLGVWAASRHTLPAGAPGANPIVSITGVISQAGVLDLARAADEGVGGDAVLGLMGGSPGDYSDRYAVADPIQLVPIGVPVRCVHAEQDDIVPIDQSESYVAAAVSVGDDATLIRVPGDHFALITVGTPAWVTIVETLAAFPV